MPRNATRSRNTKGSSATPPRSCTARCAACKSPTCRTERECRGRLQAALGRLKPAPTNGFFRRSVLDERLEPLDDEVVDRRAILYQLQTQLTAKDLQQVRCVSREPCTE